MKNSNFGFTFFDIVINFLTGQHTFFLISNKGNADQNRYEPVKYYERYAGIFDSCEDKEISFSQENENFVKSRIISDPESFAATRQLSSEVPEQFCLSQNYPNPYSEKTIINYQCPMSCFVSLKVYNVTWKEILTIVYENQSPGTYQAEFDGSALDEGIYYYRMDTENFSDTKKMFIERHRVREE
jgi:hypothetical protein